MIIGIKYLCIPNILCTFAAFLETILNIKIVDIKSMAETKKIKTALVSVFHKDGLDELLAKLNEEGVKFLSTGGTQKFIESLGYECQKVEDVTTYPSILGGRVKTLHPKIFGGILARRDNEGDQEQMKEYEIPSIDLVIVDSIHLSRL